MRQAETVDLHRIMAPRLVFLLGSTSVDGRQNCIPISNVTSVSIEPCQVLVAVYKEWQTCANLKKAAGFTLSLASRDQLDLVWKLGAKYSGYDSGRPKIEEFATELDTDFSPHGPVLKGALGWMELAIVARPDSGAGDHMMVIGECYKVMVDPRHYTADILPIETPKPLMQWEHNNFSTAEQLFSVDYYKDSGY